MSDSQALIIETERETDGRWIADVVALPGCMAYGDTEAGAIRKAKALALHVLAERIEDGADGAERASAPLFNQAS